MSDPVAVRTLIARFVTETCQAARKRERDRIIKDEEESRREAEIAAARTLCSTPPLQSSPRNLRKPPPPPPLPPRQTSQRVPLSSDLGAAPMTSVCTSERAAVRYAIIRADQRREPQPVNPFGDGDEGERHGRAEAILVREDCSPKGVRVTGREDQSLPFEVTDNDNDDDDEEDNEYIDEEFECDQQEDRSDANVGWGAPSTEEKELTDDVDNVNPQRWRQRGCGVDRYGDRDRDKATNNGNPFGDSDSDG
jgi:hypothetical protein